MVISNLSGLAFIYNIEVTTTDYGVTNENVDYTSFKLSHFVKSRDVQRVVGELTIYDNGSALYMQNLNCSATKTDVNAVSTFVLMVVKSHGLLLKVW